MFCFSYVGYVLCNHSLNCSRHVILIPSDCCLRLPDHPHIADLSVQGLLTGVINRLPFPGPCLERSGTLVPPMKLGSVSNVWLLVSTYLAVTWLFRRFHRAVLALARKILKRIWSFWNSVWRVSSWKVGSTFDHEEVSKNKYLQENYWTGEEVDISESISGMQTVFLFDNASNRTAFAEDSLTVW